MMMQLISHLLVHNSLLLISLMIKPIISLDVMTGYYQITMNNWIIFYEVGIGWNTMLLMVKPGSWKAMLLVRGKTNWDTCMGPQLGCVEDEKEGANVVKYWEWSSNNWFRIYIR